MTNRTKLMLLAGAAVLAAATTAGATSASSPSVNDYTSDQVQAMSSAPGSPSTTATLQGTLISSATVAMVAESPSAGSSVEGTAPLTNASQPCWYLNDDSMSDQWGIWPFQQKIIEHRQWCAQHIGGPQTYSASQVHIYDTLCGDSNRYTTRVAGGNGSTYTTVETGLKLHMPDADPVDPISLRQVDVVDVQHVRELLVC